MKSNWSLQFQFEVKTSDFQKEKKKICSSKMRFLNKSQIGFDHQDTWNKREPRVWFNQNLLELSGDAVIFDHIPYFNYKKPIIQTPFSWFLMYKSRPQGKFLDDSMDCTKSSEMMEADFPSNSRLVDGDSVRELLTLARQFINQRKPSQALQAVCLTKTFAPSWNSCSHRRSKSLLLYSPSF